MTRDAETAAVDEDGGAVGGTSPVESVERLAPKHPLALRWMHWINFPVLLVMMWSGMRIYWADLRDPYAIGIGGWTWFEFWPSWINGPFELERRLAKGIAFHLNFGWFFVLNGLAYAVFLATRGRWRQLIPTRRDLRAAPAVVRHDLHLGGEEPEKQGKYNAAQKVAYTTVLVMAILLVASGFAIYKPAQLAPLVAVLGGYEFARTIHFTTTILLMAFIVVHVLQVVRAGWRNFASMVTGQDDEAVRVPASPVAGDEPAGEPVAAQRRQARRAFLSFGALGVGGLLGFRWVQNRPEDDSIPDVLRSGLEWNRSVWTTLEREGASARTFSADDAEELRVNGRLGLRNEPPQDQDDGWEIEVVGVDGSPLPSITVADLKALEGRDITWEHKCIEGWSTVVTWSGVRFSDVLDAHAPDQRGWEYVALRTPDGGYYVGVDRYTMLHDQTLLAWELNGEPLTDEHGAPIRLATPLKYGIKQLKRIASIELTVERPPDYWAERGYDYHAGF